MAIKEQIEFWVKSALRDWEVAEDLNQSGKYMHSLFFAHLVVEKLLKAHWINVTGNSAPPRVHSLTVLYEEVNLKLPPDL